MEFAGRPVRPWVYYFSGTTALGISVALPVPISAPLGPGPCGAETFRCLEQQFKGPALLVHFADNRGVLKNESSFRRLRHEHDLFISLLVTRCKPLMQKLLRTTLPSSFSRAQKRRILKSAVQLRHS